MAVQTTIAGTGYGNPYVDTLISGYTWTGGDIGYAFAQGPIVGYDGEGAYWEEHEKQAFRAAIAAIEAVCDVNFVEYGDYSMADILWYLVDEATLGAPGSAAWHNLPEGGEPSIGEFRYDSNQWEYFLPGQRAFNTIMHEIGHGLGLEHPHADEEISPGYVPFPGVDSDEDTGDQDLNQGIWTIMSYVDGWSPATANNSRGHAATPMAFDIAALQAMYGVDTNNNHGDTFYVMPDENVPGIGWICIWDTGGIDGITATFDATVNVHIDLRAATLVAGDWNAGGFVSYSFTGGLDDVPREVVIDGGFTIANGVVIENATGSNAGDDELLGNSTHNKLEGLGGRDYLVGNEGNDTLIGGAGGDTMLGGIGYDTVVYDNPHTGFVQFIDLTGVGGTFDAAGDVFDSIEAVLGSQTDDIILGTNAAESLSGRGGTDYLAGRGGADVLDGGDGRDYASYTTGVRADLLFTYLNTGDALGDSYANIEGFFGSDVQDDLRGDMSNNMLIGNGGADILRGRDGNDTLQGNVGNDTLYGGLHNDSLIGESGLDVLYGEEGNDTLEGGLGNDKLYGDSGHDALSGNAGNDTMEGGEGDDFYLVEDFLDQVIELAGGGTDTIAAIVDFTLAEGSQIEELEGEGDILLTGNSGDNKITELFGESTIYGMAGNDTLNGWAGNDVIHGGPGDDVVRVAFMSDHEFAAGGDDHDTLSFYNDFDAGFEFDLDLGYQQFTASAGGEPFVIGSLLWISFEGVRGGMGDDTIYGDEADNTLSGYDGYDELHGRTGNDFIAGELGFDALYGDGGNDTLAGNYEYSAFAVDYMDGGEGSDTADFTAHNLAVWIDLLTEGREVRTRDQTTLNEGTWRDVADLVSVENIVATASNDQLFGTNDANRLDGGAGSDYIQGRDGNDTLIGGLGPDAMYGGTGNDTFVTGYDSGLIIDYLYGETGFDTADYSLFGKAVRVDLTASVGKAWTTHGTTVASGSLQWIANLNSIENAIGSGADDRLIGSTVANTFTGGGGSDTLEGGAGTDTAVFSGKSSDYAFALVTGDSGGLRISDMRAAPADGIDELYDIERLRFADGLFTPILGTNATEQVTGTEYADFVLGLKGNDRLYGLTGSDTLIGGEGNDRLEGQDDNDFFFGEVGNDTFVGGDGIDAVDFSSGAAVIADLSNATVAGGAAVGDRFSAVERLIGSSFGDELRGSVAINRIEGGGGSDFISGNSGADVLLGGDGHDTIEGGAGNDAMDGSAGNDTLIGGTNYDTLTGGAGADMFVFNGKPDHRDTITDFTGIDVIGLSASGFGVANLADVDFISGTAPKAGTGPALLYNTTTGQLSFDADGLGGTAAFAFAVLTGAPTLSIDDFMLV